MTYQDIDVYQERYLKHQERKTRTLKNRGKEAEGAILRDKFDDIVDNRVSQRVFNKEKVTRKELNYIKKVIINTPSSCNRQPIKIKLGNKQEVEQSLVGGRGWIDKADIILVLLADMKAYKSPNEIDFMPYLDAGFIGMSVYYACERLGLGCCFVNPNGTLEVPDGYRLCGAIAIGNYDKKAKKVKKSKDIFL